MQFSPAENACRIKILALHAYSSVNLCALHNRRGASPIFSGLIRTGRITQANGTCSWEYPHCTQATSKDLHSTLRARALCRLGLNPPRTDSAVSARFFFFRRSVPHRCESSPRCVSRNLSWAKHKDIGPMLGNNAACSPHATLVQVKEMNGSVKHFLSKFSR